MSNSTTRSNIVVRSPGSLTVEAGATVNIGAATHVGGFIVEEVTQAIAFGDLGSGASDDIAITGVPDGVFVLGAYLEVDDEAAGESDLAAQMGYTADPDGLMTSQGLDAVTAGTVLAGDGALTGFAYVADATSAGLGVRFTATELDDVTAGAWTAHVLFVRPTLATS